MKTISKTIKVLASVLVLTSYGITLGANRTWTGAESEEWSNASNWSDGNMPGIADTAIFSAGVWTVQNTGTANIKGLTVNSTGTNTVEITGGTLNIGDDVNTPNFLISSINNNTTNRVVLNNTSLNVGGTTPSGTFAIGSQMSNGSTTYLGSLNMTNGAFNVCVNGFYVGAKTVEQNAVHRGALIVNSPAHANITANSLYIGKGRLNNAAGAGVGNVAFEGASGSLNVYSDLYIGAGTSSTGTLLLDEKISVNIGKNETERADVYIGYNPRDASAASNGTISFGGNITMFLNSLYAGFGRSGCNGLISYTYTPNSSVYIGAKVFAVGYCFNFNVQTWDAVVKGLWDMKEAQDITFTAETVFIGYSTSTKGGMHGSVLLGKGKGLVGDITLGRAAAKSASSAGILEMYGMAMNITNSFTFNRSGAVVSYVGNSSSGLHFANDITLTINASATTNNTSGITVIFDADPAQCRYVENPENADAVFWGFKWDGNKTEEIETLRNARQFGWEFEGMSKFYSDKVQVFFDPGLGTEERPFNTTYLGFYIKQAHPATFIAIR